MKKAILYFFLFLATGMLHAQEFQEISTGAGYSKQSYVSLSNGTQTQVNNDAWDIGFSISSFDVGVFINESAGTVQGQPQPAIEIYDAGTTDFTSQPDPSAVTDHQLFNSEASWASGALNEAFDPNNPFDFGWGTYDPTTHEVTGGRVYVVKLRNGEYRKLQVQSLIGTVYTFRYAKLDGSNEVNKTIDKTAFPGNTLAYFSFATSNTVDVEPATGFDLLYTRYFTPLYDPATMTNIPYAVTGVLSGNGVEVARANGVDPATVTYAAWEDSLKSELNIIGYDWKSFSGTAWSLDQDLVYFVKTANSNVWKLQFIDFEGSTTGTAVFEKTNLGGASAVNDPSSEVTAFNVFPNPTAGESNLVFSMKKSAGKANLSITNMTGNLVFQTSFQVTQGLNGMVLPTDNLPAGLYIVQLNLANGASLNHKLVVK